MSEHSHVCAVCLIRYVHADEDCEAFFIGLCAECEQPGVEPDAPPPEDEPINVETEQ
ncbi:MAG TPA: hypothetical protein VIP46_22610 [Pyrinomonadaceae bacterium]